MDNPAIADTDAAKASKYRRVDRDISRTKISRSPLEMKRMSSATDSAVRLRRPVARDDDERLVADDVAEDFESVDELRIRSI